MAAKPRKRCSLAGIDVSLILPGRTRSSSKEFIKRRQYLKLLKSRVKSKNSKNTSQETPEIPAAPEKYDFNAALEAELPWDKVKGIALAREFMYSRHKRLVRKLRKPGVRLSQRKLNRRAEAADEELRILLWEEFMPREQLQQAQVEVDQEQEQDNAPELVPPERWVYRTPVRRYYEDMSPPPFSLDSSYEDVNGMYYEMNDGERMYYEMDGLEGMPSAMTPAPSTSCQVPLQELQVGELIDVDAGEFSLELDWTQAQLDEDYAHAHNA